MVSPKSVLVVQYDSRSLTNLIKEFERVNCKVLSYSNGLDAKKDIEDGIVYDLAILDVVCGDIHGSEVLNKSKRVNPDVPVIIYSGYQIPQLPLANRIVPKPMNIMVVARDYL